jgi:hypothetical protein
LSTAWTAWFPLAHAEIVPSSVTKIKEAGVVVPGTTYVDQPPEIALASPLSPYDDMTIFSSRDLYKYVITARM